MRRIVALVAVVLTTTSAAASAQPQRHAASPLNVLAAASLTQVFPQIDSAEHYSFSGSDVLEAQIKNGAPADVFASASPKYTDILYAAGLIEAPFTFATNQVVLIVPRSNPANIHSVYDLERSGVKLVIGNSTVPVGSYTRTILRNMGILSKVLPQVVSNETDVKQVVAKVALGEADAGFVYVTDVRPVRNQVGAAIKPPAWAQPRVRYTIAVVKASADITGARAFVRRVKSTVGRKLLLAAGFGLLPLPTTTK